MISPVPVARLLDTAAAAAWECRGKRTAVGAALGVIRSGEESAGALQVWADTVGCAPGDLGGFVESQCKDRAGVATSLMRAALLAEQEARVSR